MGNFDEVGNFDNKVGNFDDEVGNFDDEVCNLMIKYVILITM